MYLSESSSCLDSTSIGISPKLFVAFIHNGPLQELGLSFIDPWTWIRQAHLTRSVRFHFYPLQLSPSPFLVHHYWEGGPARVTVKNLWVDGSRFMGWRLKWLSWRFKVYRLKAQMTRLTVTRLMGWQLKMQTSLGVQTSDKLFGSIYGAWHVLFFDWFLSQIEVSLCLPCTFPINTKVFSSHFFIFNWNTLLECNRHPCQTNPFILLYRPSTHLLRSLGLSVVDSKAKKLVSVLLQRVLQIHFLF